MFMLADSFLIYLFNFAVKEESEGEEIPRQKFIGMSLWVIGYFMALIFGDNRGVAALSLVIYACSLGEHLIMNSSEYRN